jgi:mannan endo-1,6-alpha-mannosidase
MFSFKSYLTRWLASVTLIAPYTYPLIMPYLRASAAAAALQCNGGDTGRVCGLSWSQGTTWDGTNGVGQQMAAMSVMFVNLLALETIAPPLTNITGGTSVGNPDAGSDSVANPEALKPATQADRVGAGIITALLLGSISGMFGWMSV